MKKWLSLIVMSCILFGAAYIAVATERGRKAMKSTDISRNLLAEIDFLLSTDRNNPELIAKRAVIVDNLVAQGVNLESLEPEVKDEAYMRSIGASDEEINEALGQSNESVEKVKDADYYRANGMFDELERLEQEQAVANESYLEQLLAREHEGLPLSESEKMDLMESGLLEGERESWDNLDDTGGPSVTFGYRWVDNQGADTATYAWEEIDANWTELTTLASSDDGNEAFSWGWNFSFFGTGYTSGFVTTNGYIAFGSGSGDYSNDCRRSNSTPSGPAVFGYWDDGHSTYGASSDGGRILYRDFGDHVTVTWDSLGTCCTTGGDILDYQVQLWNNGKIKIQYREIQKLTGTSINGTSPTIGIQQSNNAGGLDSLIYFCSTVRDTAYTNNLDGRAVWFYQLFLDNDFSCNGVVEPSPLRMSPGEVFEVIGTFRNAGNVTQSSPVSYQFNGGAVVTEATAVLAQGVSEVHDFAGTETAPLTVGDYELVLWTGLALDEDNSNDTCRVTIQVRECYDEAQADGFTDTGTTCGQLNDWSNTCLGSADGGEDFIYRWTTTTNGAWNLQLLAPTAATRGLVVSSSCPPDSFNCINQFQDTLSLNCVPLAAGTYYIMVDRSSSCDATYTLNVTPCTDIGRCCYDGGANCVDNGAFDCQQLAGNWERGVTCASSPCPLFINGGETCVDAVLLPVPATVRSSTTGGFDDDPGFTCESNFNSDDYFGSNTAEDKWYKIIGTGNTITVSLCASYTSFDTQILVTCTADCQNFTCVGGNDDAFTAGCPIASSRSIEWFCSEVGREYYVVVDGWGTADGNFELAITDDGIPCQGAVDCAPEGRCCYLAAGVPMCTDNLAADCALLGGQWDDLANCASSPCPVGRCCYNGGANCADNTELECIALAGAWEEGITCAGSPCPLFLEGGDNCITAVDIPVPSTVRGTLVGGTDQDPGFNCESNLNGDDYFGTNTAPDKWYRIIGTGNIIVVSLCNAYTTFDTQILVTCTEDCINFTCVGGNDDAFTAGCSFSSLRSVEWFCSELGREYYIVPDGYGSGTGGPYELAIRDSIPCNTFVNCSPLGRCCYLDNGAPTCVDNLAGDCSALGGQWDQTVLCATSPCPVGRCCYLNNGIADCEDNTELECNVLNGDWDAGLSCTTDPCPLGRCCYNGGDNCADNIEAACALLGGLWDPALTCATGCPTILQGSDDCIDATPIPLFNQQYVGTIIGYAGETALPVCATWYSTTDPAAVWYSFIGTGNSITASLCDPLSDYDSEIGVFCGETCETLVCVGSNDDFCSFAGASQITFCSVLGAEYKLLITAFSTSSIPGNFALILTDDGISCQATVQCPVTVLPCDPVVDLRGYVVTAANLADHLQLHFTAPQDADYKVWYTINPNNDGNPDAGADPDFVLEDTILGVLENDLVVWNSLDPFASFRYYVVTADCTP